MRVALFPNTWRGTPYTNPYFDLLETHLQDQGVDVFPSETDFPFRSWLVAHCSHLDVLHFHFLSYMYKAGRLSDALVTVLRFSARLITARRLGYRIVWTMHNLWPHERPYPFVDVFARRLIVCLSHAVIVHCQRGKELFKQTFGREQSVYVIPHGHFIGCYPNQISREEARQRLGLAKDVIAFAAIGGVRKYKRFDHLILAFRSLPDDDLRLLIAGKPVPHQMQQQVKVLAKGDSRVRLHFGPIHADDMQVFHNAADAIVSASNLLTSGSLILGLSFAKPVIAPATGCLPELISPEVGVLYDSEVDGALAAAMASSSSLDLARMGRRAYELIQRFSWDHIAAKTAAVYRKIISNETTG